MSIEVRFDDQDFSFLLDPFPKGFKNSRLFPLTVIVSFNPSADNFKGGNSVITFQPVSSCPLQQRNFEPFRSTISLLEAKLLELLSFLA